MLYLKTFLGIIFQVSLFGLFLLLPAPNWYWPDAFIWLVFYFLLNLITSFWICAYYPESMEARLESDFKKQFVVRPFGERSAAQIITENLLTHGFTHVGEILMLKRLQGISFLSP